MSKGSSNILDVVNVEFFFLSSWGKKTSICNMISLMFINLSVVIFIFFPCLLDNSSPSLPFSFFKCSYLLILVCHSHHFYGVQRESNLANLINHSHTIFCRYKKCIFPSFLKSYKDNIPCLTFSPWLPEQTLVNENSLLSLTPLQVFLPFCQDSLEILLLIKCFSFVLCLSLFALFAQNYKNYYLINVYKNLFLYK